ncbi:MAG: exo-beta-N-acetylmuramidase NamZ family protein [Myxococcaceae bacterium]
MIRLSSALLVSTLTFAACHVGRSDPLTEQSLPSGREPTADGSVDTPTGASGPNDDAGSITDAGHLTVRNGVDQLLTAPALIQSLQGKRLGLITNQTGRLLDGGSSIDALFEHPGLHLVALFSPEHGIRGTADAGASVPDAVDAKTGLPVRSLYGATRKPTPAMLADVDVLLFDIQDVGARYFTYVWTMALAMEAAAEQQKQIIVLDRPNPIGGLRVEGNVLDPAFKTFVGLYPVPMRHGLTAGELARYLKGEHGIAANLSVVPLVNWSRAQHFEDTGLTWIRPSPAMLTPTTALHYAGTCLFEGTNLATGRGTSLPFEQFGAPWLSHTALAQKLNALNLPGARFDAVTFTPDSPTDNRFNGQLVNGVRFVATNPATYQPVTATLAFLVEARALHGAQVGFTSYLDSLAGTDQLRLSLISGKTVSELTTGWGAQLAAFEQRRAPYLLY